MKRVPITIQHKKNPEIKVSGYALAHEILDEQVSFFATQKFPVDEELIVCYSDNGKEQCLNVVLRNMHEQISSGRVMISVPSESDPFPARKFYRCYTVAVGAAAATGNSTEETTEASSTSNETAETAVNSESSESSASDTPVADVPGEENKAA